jgi:hypothetical protein
MSAVPPVRDPKLGVGTSYVAALWECGCVAVGPNFESLTLNPCHVHEEIETRPTVIRSGVADRRKRVQTRGRNERIQATEPA